MATVSSWLTYAAMALVGLAVLWMLASTIGCSLRAIRVRKVARNHGEAALLCGAYGHQATALERVVRVGVRDGRAG